VAACNPCPCGFYGDPSHDCSCTPYQVQRYISRLSGPLLDRIDIQIEVPRLPFEEISSDVQAESSRKIKDRVDSARERQRVRMKPPACNARMGPKEVRRYCKLSPFARTLLREAFKNLSMSARAHDRILKVALTIADLDGDEIIQDIHVAEAVQYRSLDRIFI